MASELVGNVERSISQSSHITEIWFYQHNEVKRKVLEALVDTARIAWRTGKKINFVTDDLGRIMLNIDGSEFANSQYGVHVGNTAKDTKALETAKGMLQTAIQADKVSLSSAISVLNSDSISDIRIEIEQGEENLAQRTQQAQESAQQSQEKMAQGQQQAAAQAAQLVAQEAQTERDLRRETNIRDNDTKLQIAFKPDDSMPEVQDHTVENRRLDIDENKSRETMRLEHSRLAETRRKNDLDAKAKDKDTEVKRIAANKKPSSPK